MPIRIVALFAVLALAAGGCSTLKKVQSYASEALSFANPAPEIDYQDLPNEGPEEVLAYLFTPVDERIQLLAEEISTVDTRPDREWYTSFGVRYPWLSGLSIIDAEGNTELAVPEQGMRPLPVERLMALRDSWERTSLAVDVQTDELGSEIYFVQPLTTQGKWTGLIVVHFDPRSLQRYCPAPERLLVMTPEQDLWPFERQEDREAMHSVDWPDELSDDVSGKLEAGNREYHWLGRRLGKVHILYAVGVDG